MKRNKLLAGAAASVILGISACSSATDDNGGSGSGSGGDGGGSGEGIVIGFSVYDMQYEFFQKMEEGTRAAAGERSWEFRLHDEKSDENEMVTGAQALLDQGVDVLVISPFKPDALGPIINKAQQLGIPVIVNDIGGGGTPYDAIVISDNENGGVQAAEYIDEQIQAMGLESQKVVSITCEPSAVYAARRNIGFRNTIEELGYDVVTELSGNSKAEEAYKIMKDALAKNPDVAGVFACNDPMAVAASNAIRDAGLDPVNDIVTVGFNGDAEALTAIEAGQLSATVAQDPSAMGALTIELAAALLDGEELPFDNADEREVYQDVVRITPENVADFTG